MSTTVDAETLRKWLEERRPVILVDVRSEEDRAQWAIPGSLHVDAYSDLRQSRPGRLEELEFPKNAPIVTVCSLGFTSETAAEYLRGRGLSAMSLAGGMKAWSLAWNTAAVPAERTPATVLQVRRTGKGCLSYLLASEGAAAVIDPSLAPAVYLELAASQGSQIRFVLDTHIHADHLSRARALALECGAEVILPSQNRARFPFRAVSDGGSIAIGAARLEVLDVPGHTPESAAYVLDNEMLFTGDTLFLSAVGRPDLHATDDQARERAAILYRSLRRLLALDPTLLVLPGHTSEPVPFDNQPHSARLAEVRRDLEGWFDSEAAFVERVLSRIPPTPPNFARIIELNEAGTLPEGDPAALEAGANRCAIR